MISETTGSGPTALLLHGSGSSRRCFDPQVEVLSKSHTCVAWDAPGYGESADPLGPPSIDDYAAAIQETADGLDLDRPMHVVGLSWGGLLAIAFAHRYPDSVASLTLIGPSLGAANDSDEIGKGRIRLLAFQRDRFRYAEERVALVSQGHPHSDARRNIYANMQALRSPGFGYALRSMESADGRGMLSKVRAPIRLMWGANDKVAGESSRSIARGLPGKSWTVIPNAGHMANQDQPSLVNDALRSFWDTTRSTA